MRRLIHAFLLMTAVLYAYAQDLAHCTDEDFRDCMNAIVSKGNHFYDVDNRAGIKQMADSLISAIEQRSKTRRLNRTDSLDYLADWHKLMGSYYYEESYYDSTAYVHAQECYNQALAIYQNTPEFEGDLDKEPMIHRELAQLYYKQGKYKLALEHTTMAFEAFKNAVNNQEIDDDDAEYLDIQTQLAICQARVGLYKEANTMMNKLIDSYNHQDIRYGEALRKKAKILMLEEEHGDRASRTEALNCYKKYFALKKKDALNHFMGMSSSEREQYWMHIRPFIADCYRLEDADAGFLYDVTLFAKGLLLQLDSAGGGRRNIHATWQIIQRKLKPDACAIEFVQYEKYGHQQMGALVLKKTGKPIFVTMPKPDDVMNYEIGARTVKERLYDIHGERKNALYNDSTGFFRLIWNEKLLSAIGKAKMVYFAPDGYIHQIAIEYMLPFEISSIKMYRLSSTRTLLQKGLAVREKQALVIGGVDYSHADDVIAGNNDQVAYNNLKGSGDFRYLKGSLSEVEDIIGLRHHTGDTLIVSDKATEQTFRKICGKYPIIHLSTHGIFTAAMIPQGTDLKPCQTDESLSQSVVALAGIQAALNNRAFDSSNQEGALSAKELSSLDMRNVEIVVLSCCETGLGYVTSDGVYGIQRGLKNAGVRAIICTLWDVWDEAATFFMTNFHRHLSDGLSVYQAFYKARNDMKDYSTATEDALSFNAATMAQQQTAEDYDFSNPSDRNVFILIDAIE